MLELLSYLTFGGIAVGMAVAYRHDPTRGGE